MAYAARPAPAGRVIHSLPNTPAARTAVARRNLARLEAEAQAGGEHWQWTGRHAPDRAGIERKLMRDPFTGHTKLGEALLGTEPMAEAA